MNRTFYVLVLMGVMLGASARADGPDYEGTVSYIKSRVNGALTEQKRCIFGAKSPQAQHEQVFDAGALEVVPSVIKASEVHFDCKKGASCVAHTAEKKTVMNFSVNEDAEGVAIAISRLVEMCGAGVAH
jgi:hypothetical protein